MQIFTTTFLAVGISAIAVHGASLPRAAAPGNISCTPKLRGSFRFGSAASGYVDVLLKVQAQGSPQVIDSQGKNASLLISSDRGPAESWDFLECESTYMGYKGDGKSMFGQLRPSPKGNSTAVSNLCLTTQAQDLHIPSGGSVVSNFTSSAGCDVDDVTQVQRFFQAQYDSYEGFWAINFIADTAANSYQDPSIDYYYPFFGRSDNKAPFQVTITDFSGDRKASPETQEASKRQAATSEPPYGCGSISNVQKIALLGHTL